MHISGGAGSLNCTVPDWTLDTSFVMFKPEVKCVQRLHCILVSITGGQWITNRNAMQPVHCSLGKSRHDHERYVVAWYTCFWSWAWLEEMHNPSKTCQPVNYYIESPLLEPCPIRNDTLQLINHVNLVAPLDISKISPLFTNTVSMPCLFAFEGSSCSCKRLQIKRVRACCCTLTPLTSSL